MTLYAVAMAKYDKLINTFVLFDAETCDTKESAIYLADHYINDEVRSHLDAGPEGAPGYENAIKHIKHMAGVCYGKYRRDSTYKDEDIEIRVTIQETDV